MCTTFHDQEGTILVEALGSDATPETESATLGRAVPSLEARIFASHKRDDVNPLQELRHVVLHFASGKLSGQPMRMPPLADTEEEETPSSRLCARFPCVRAATPMSLKLARRVILWNDMVSIRRDKPNERTADANAIPDILTGPSSVIVMCLSPRYLQSVWCIMELMVITKLLLDPGHRARKYFFTCLCSKSGRDGHNVDKEAANTVGVFHNATPREMIRLESPLAIFEDFTWPDWPNLDKLRDEGRINASQHAWLSKYVPSSSDLIDYTKVVKTTLLYGLGTFLQHRSIGSPDLVEEISDLVEEIRTLYKHVHEEELFDEFEDHDYKTIHYKCLAKLGTLMNPYRTNVEGSEDDEGSIHTPPSFSPPLLLSQSL
jgi:hypothetical protein